MQYIAALHRSSVAHAPAHWCYTKRNGSSLVVFFGLMRNSIYIHTGKYTIYSWESKEQQNESWMFALCYTVCTCAIAMYACVQINAYVCMYCMNVCMRIYIYAYIGLQIFATQLVKELSFLLLATVIPKWITYPIKEELNKQTFGTIRFVKNSKENQLCHGVTGFLYQ